MHSANWWMMGLSFVLGLLLTLALMVRRVTREVPVSTPLPEAVKPPLDRSAAATVPAEENEKPAAKAVERATAGAVAESVSDDAAAADAAVTLVRSDHSDAEATMRVVGGDTVPPEAAIRFVTEEHPGC